MRQDLLVPKLLPIETIADQLGVSMWTARTWARRGLFPSVKLGRRVLVREADVLALIDERTVRGRVPIADNRSADERARVRLKSRPVGRPRAKVAGAR
jgi:excisionase family DNA binding protein